MDKPCQIQVKLELGHRAEIRKKPTSTGMTHDWCVFVRGPEGRSIHSFIDKVVFHLHESFPKPKRVVKEPPYELHECGYGSFELPIDIYFKNNEEPKKITFAYELFLQLPDQPPIYNVRCEKLTFQNPTPDFKKRLIKACGELLRPHQPSDHSDDEGSNSEEDDNDKSSASSSPSSAPSSPPRQPMAQVHSAKPLPLPSAKNPTTRAVPMAAVKPLQQQQASPHETAGRPAQPTSVESQPFTELFGTPVKLDSVKKTKISSSSKESSSKHHSKESGKHAKKRSPDSHDETATKKRKSSSSHQPDDRQSDKKKSDKKSREKSSSKKEDSSSSHRKSHKSSRQSHTSGSKGLPSEKSVLPSFADEVCTVSDEDSWSDSFPSGKDIKTTPESPMCHAPKSVMKKSPCSQSQSSHNSTHSSDSKKASPLSDGKTSNKKSPSSCSPKHASKLPSSDHYGAKKKEKSENDDKQHGQNSSKSSFKKSLSSVVAELNSDEDDDSADIDVKSSKEKKHRKHKVSEKHQWQLERRHSKEKMSVGKSSKDSGHVDKSPSTENSVKSDRAIAKLSESVTDDVCEEKRKSESKKCAKAPNGALVSDLLEIQALLMQLQNRDKLRKVAGIIFETGHYSTDGSTFDFDLCNLSHDTIQKMKSFLQ